MSTRILAIDPGNEQSGYALVVDGAIQSAGVMVNSEILRLTTVSTPDVLAIEWIQSMGMAVGKEVFETCLWAGRFVQASGHVRTIRLVPRGALKLHHCGSARAKDPNIVQSLKDKYGDRGTKAKPGYFYGVSSHAWQAFAVAAYVMEGGTHDGEIKPIP
ncbi:MAG: hypothetical protein QM755_23825 [Luteolibacter sp.]